MFYSKPQNDCLPRVVWPTFSRASEADKERPGPNILILRKEFVIMGQNPGRICELRWSGKEVAPEPRLKEGTCERYDANR